MTNNTQINADDELALWESMFGSLTEARAGDYVAHYRDFIRRLKVYSKKHELEVRMDEVGRIIERVWGLDYGEETEKYLSMRDAELKQELEKL